MHSDTFAFRHSLSYVRPASYPYPDSINPNIPNSPPSFHLCSERDFPSKVRLLYNYINIHHQCDLRRSCRLWLANRLITASFNTPPIRLSIRHAISLHALKRVYPSTKYKYIGCAPVTCTMHPPACQPKDSRQLKIRHALGRLPFSLWLDLPFLNRMLGQFKTLYIFSPDACTRIELSNLSFPPGKRSFPLCLPYRHRPQFLNQRALSLSNRL